MVPIQNRPVHNRPLMTDHSKQTTFITDHVHNRPQQNYFMWPNNFSDLFVFCCRMFCFILQTSECFRWVSLTYNHSVVTTVYWNAVTSVKNISCCGPQKSTVIVSFLWSTVRCLLCTDHNKKVKPPVSHPPISKETVFRKIHFIVAYAETIIKRFWKGVIYRPVLHMHAILVFCAVLWNRSCR